MMMRILVFHDGSAHWHHSLRFCQEGWCLKKRLCCIPCPVLMSMHLTCCHTSGKIVCRCSSILYVYITVIKQSDMCIYDTHLCDDAKWELCYHYKFVCLMFDAIWSPSRWFIPTRWRMFWIHPRMHQFSIGFRAMLKFLWDLHSIYIT